MRDTPLEHNGLVAERQAQFVKGIEREREPRLDRRAAAADLLDLQRLEHHDFALEIAENQNALGVALIRLGTHPRAL
jgi:hypothetical protein